MSMRRPQCRPGTMLYRVRPGDTFYRIARDAGIPLGELISANPGVNPEQLRVGQYVCVPRRRRFPRCSPRDTVYRVRPGDTMYGIAGRFGVSLSALLDANPLTDPNYLGIGEVICIPRRSRPRVCPPAAGPYVIRPGDTFYQLARRFGLTVRELIDANPDVNPNALIVGQTICIPE